MLYFNLGFRNKNFHSVLRRSSADTQSVFIVTEYFNGFSTFSAGKFQGCAQNYAKAVVLFSNYSL